MKIRYSAKNNILVAIMGLLGVSSCEMPVEYGCPQTNFKVHGTVTDEQHNPLGGIVVQTGWHYDSITHSRQWGLTDTTDPYGTYQITTVGVDLKSAPDSIAFADADKINGDYRDTVFALNFNGVRPEGGDGHWFQGTYTLRKDVILKKK